MKKRSEVGSATPTNQTEVPGSNLTPQRPDPADFTNGQPSPQSALRQPEDTGPNVFPTSDEGEVVSVTWGQETIRIAEYVSCVVGPFSSDTKVRAGETRSDAVRRVNVQLTAVAEAERVRKVKSMHAMYATATGSK